MCNLGQVFEIEALVWVSFRRALKFHLFNWSVGSNSNPRRRSKHIIMKYKTRVKLVHELCGTCFQYNVNKLGINNLPPLLIVTMPYACRFLWRANYIEDFKWRLHSQYGVAFWGGCFEQERYILKGQIAFEWHWRLQSWTTRGVESPHTRWDKTLGSRPILPKLYLPGHRRWFKDKRLHKQEKR
jgi:hypothetical protein